MKVVFLDIDGVLQPFGRQERFKHIDEVPALCKMLNDERGIDFDFAAWCDRNSLACYDIASVYYDWDEASINFYMNFWMKQMPGSSYQQTGEKKAMT